MQDELRDAIRVWHSAATEDESDKAWDKVLWAARAFCAAELKAGGAVICDGLTVGVFQKQNEAIRAFIKAVADSEKDLPSGE